VRLLSRYIILALAYSTERNEDLLFEAKLLVIDGAIFLARPR
jgi:hypothetical protein